MSDICVIIPMFNKAEMTKKCISMTVENAGMDVDILVVDDGSEVPFEDERVFVLRIDENLGFTNAVNEGMLYCRDDYKYLHLLNNDTEPEMDFIKTLYDVMEADFVVGIASSSRVHAREGGSHYIENYGVDLVRGYQMVSDSDLQEPIIYVDWLPTCSSLLRMRMVREIGLLDPQFRNHCSDAEYCLRANMNEWNVALVPNSRVLHHWSQTTMENKVDPGEDQKKFIAKLAGLKYAELMKRVPLDCENKTYGSLQFTTYNK